MLVLAQKGNYTPLPLKDLSAFENTSSNWSVKGDVSVLPSANAKLKSKPGEGILVGTSGEAIISKVKAKDLRFSADFMLAPGASGYVLLPGGQKILISDSYKDPQIGTSTSGFAGISPIQNASKAPGLWQNIEINFDASLPDNPKSSRINTLKINDVTVQETAYLPVNKLLNADGESFGFKVNSGTMAFRNIGYQLLENSKPLTVSDLKFKVYKDSWDSKTYEKLDHEGTTKMITQEVTNGLKEFHLVYTGAIEVSETGEYIFTTIYSGPLCTLEIDGKPVVEGGQSTSQESHRGNISLSKGSHSFKLHYARFPWRSPALGLKVEKAGIRAYDLHMLSSLPVPDPKPYMSVTPEMKPEMVRSFVLLPGEIAKRTKCISVGSPNGWNYTMDLDRGALVQAWRGQFADVTEMWYQRGEPQLLYPAGLTVPVSGKSSFAKLANDSTIWPDSANVAFKGYTLNGTGFPAFRYEIDNSIVTDELVSSNAGITRTLSKSSGGELFALLAEAKKIIELEKGLFQINDDYFIRTDKKSKVTIRNSANKQELILPFTSQISYTLFW